MAKSGTLFSQILSKDCSQGHEEDKGNRLKIQRHAIITDRCPQHRHLALANADLATPASCVAGGAKMLALFGRVQKIRRLCPKD